MSLFQCENCGCAENTALSSQGFRLANHWYDWTDIEERQGKLLCSACGPPKYDNGELSGYGEWHGVFDQVFLPKGQFQTNRFGNLEHIESGSEDYRQYAIQNTKDKEVLNVI